MAWNAIENPLAHKNNVRPTNLAPGLFSGAFFSFG
jgi:hypothetical protein